MCSWRPPTHLPSRSTSALQPKGSRVVFANRSLNIDGSAEGGGCVDPELIAAQNVSWMMCLELRARQGEDTGELAAFRRHERRKREVSGYVSQVDARYRVANARGRLMACVMQWGQHRRVSSTHRRKSCHGRSRSGRGSPPGDPDEVDPGDDHSRLVAGGTGGNLEVGARRERWVSR